MIGDANLTRWLILAAALTLPGCFKGFTLLPSSGDDPLSETLITKADSCLCRNKIALIDVSGVIMNARSPGLLSNGDNPVSLFREKLDEARYDKHVKAVVLRINSPG